MYFEGAATLTCPYSASDVGGGDTELCHNPVRITVKLRYNVFLGIVKNSTLYQRYIVTTEERFSYFIINPNPINQTPVHYSALLYCFLKKLSKVIWVVQRPFLV